MTNYSQSQTNPRTYGNGLTIPAPYDQTLSQIINLDPKYFQFLKRIFIGRKRFRKVFYSLTTIGDSIGYERSWTGRLAYDLRNMGLIRIHGRHMKTHLWELGDALTNPVVYSYLHDIFMGFGISHLLSNVAPASKSPLLILNKKITIRNGEETRGRSPRDAQKLTEKRNFIEYCQQWDFSRWINLQNITGQPNNPMDDALAMEIFG